LQASFGGKSEREKEKEGLRPRSHLVLALLAVYTHHLCRSTLRPRTITPPPLRVELCSPHLVQAILRSLVEDNPGGVGEDFEVRLKSLRDP
jgi:hypothetical protein